jgi:hypothetical protein
MFLSFDIRINLCIQATEVNCCSKFVEDAGLYDCRLIQKPERDEYFFLFEDNLYWIKGLMAAQKSTFYKNDEWL